MALSAIPPPRTLIVWEPTSTIQDGYIKANGAAISRTAYAWLFGRIGTAYGAGDGSTTFNVPDLRAQFLRGLDDGRGVDTGRVLGSLQLDAYQDHKHTIAATNGAYNAQAGALSTAGTSNTGLTATGLGYRTAAETRPTNVAGYYCIAYAP